VEKPFGTFFWPPIRPSCTAAAFFFLAIEKIIPQALMFSLDYHKRLWHDFPMAERAYAIRPGPMYQSQKPVKDEAYLRFIRRLFCLVCGRSYAVEGGE
jgi:hypothetical protein